ncbi:MAG: hypothetical protein AAF978_06305 [Cyanobacteria bacterium P01_E01_bin.48]
MPTTSAASVDGLATGGSVSAIFQGEDGIYTVEDAALALSAIYVPSLLTDSNDGEAFADVAEAILRDDSIATVSPLPTLETIDFVEPAGTLDLKDVSVFLAAAGLESASLSDLDRIASRASLLFGRREGFRSSDILRVLVPEVNIEGAWSGSVRVINGTEFYSTQIGSEFGVTFNLSLTGSEITGTWSDVLGGGGSLEGTLNGLQIERLGLIDSTPDCSGRSAGNGSFNEDFSQITFTLSGRDCDGSFTIESSETAPPIRQ